jgi:hypothetical protein
MTPKPAPMFANSALSMTAIFAKVDDGSYVTSGITPSLVLVDQTGANQTTRMDPDGTGYYVASLAVTKPGNYSANIAIQTPTGTYSNGTTFSVYPETGVRFRTDDPSQPDPIVGEDYTLAVDSYDPDTLTLKDPGNDLTLTLERWSDDHLTLFDAHAYPMQHVRTGVWKFEHTFGLKGMYHLRFSSVAGGFKPDDVPILHTYANDPTAGPPNKVPAPAILGVAAVALAAWATRRRR